MHGGIPNGRDDQPAAGRNGHVPDAEIHWPSIQDSPYPGQVWAVEVELTPKPLARTIRIMSPAPARAGRWPRSRPAAIGR